LSIAQNKDGSSQLLGDFYSSVYSKMNIDRLMEDLDIAWHGKAEPGMMEYIKIQIENGRRPE